MVLKQAFGKNIMFKFILKINFLLLLFLGSSFAEIVNSIDITGNKRLSKDIDKQNR